MKSFTELGTAMATVTLTLLAFFFASLPTAHAVGVAGYRLDGSYDNSVVNKSRLIKMTIRRGCKNQRRMRRATNYQTKCQTKYKRRLRNTRARKSVILQRSAPRLRRTSVSRRSSLRRVSTRRPISPPSRVKKTVQRRYRRETYREAAIRHHQQRARKNRALDK